MIDICMYRNCLLAGGSSLSQVRKTQSARIIDSTFNSDPNCKSVRVLTKDGWKLFDAKYQYHQIQSISKDAVDWYLQFHTGVHFPIGTYVIIPDDDDVETPTFEDELDYFKHHEENLANHKYPRLWFIVNRDRANTFVRYNVLQCNWNFQWIYGGKIQNCIGALRDASSYTSGIWFNTYSWQLDSVTGFWIPDAHALYRDKLEEFGLSDSRTIIHDTRFMLTNNSFSPNIYRVSKVLDMYPQGIVKFTLKQDEFDQNRDNIPLRICDYYSRHGSVETTEPYHYEYDRNQIMSMRIHNGEIVPDGIITSMQVQMGKTYYFGIKDWDYDWNPDWRLRLHEASRDEIHEDSYYENLISIENVGKTVIMAKAGKAHSLIGKRFTLCVCDADGYSHSSIELEVINAA